MPALRFPSPAVTPVHVSPFSTQQPKTLTTHTRAGVHEHVTSRKKALTERAVNYIYVLTAQLLASVSRVRREQVESRQEMYLREALDGVACVHGSPHPPPVYLHTLAINLARF